VSNRTKISLLVVLLALLIGASLVSAQEGIPANPFATPRVPFAALTITGPELSPAQEQAVLNYWTTERLLAAQPMANALDMAAAPDLSGVDAARVDPFAGRYGASPAGAPEAGADDFARAAYPDAWAAGDDLDALPALDGAQGLDDKEALSGTSQVYTSYFLDATAVQKLWPHRVVGRTSSPSGTCTATSISNNHIVTAAHCVYNTTSNVWITNMVFQPAYRNGSAPYGTFPVGACTILTAWANYTGGYSVSWAKNDVAVCNVGNNSANKTLNNAVGWAGREWNFDYNRHFFNLGYPGRDYRNLPISAAGKYLNACVAEAGSYSTDIRFMGCNMGPGISGGPWLSGYALNRVSGSVSGVNSGIFINTQNAYGARFSSANIVPICTATGC
jgi:V8-like Glu-specific endopeptidase